MSCFTRTGLDRTKLLFSQQTTQVSPRYARVATLLRLSLLTLCGWKSLLYLYLSETLWSVPPHPASAMFVTNHGSTTAGGESTSSPACIPTRSTYAGRWYSLLTLGTNYHCEHHDFPRIPLHRLGQIRSLVLVQPHYYRQGSSDNLGKILLKAFGWSVRLLRVSRCGTPQRATTTNLMTAETPRAAHMCAFLSFSLSHTHKQNDAAKRVIDSLSRFTAVDSHSKASGDVVRSLLRL